MLGGHRSLLTRFFHRWQLKCCCARWPLYSPPAVDCEGATNPSLLGRMCFSGMGPNQARAIVHWRVPPSPTIAITKDHEVLHALHNIDIVIHNLHVVILVLGDTGPLVHPGPDPDPVVRTNGPSLPSGALHATRGTLLVHVIEFGVLHLPPLHVKPHLPPTSFSRPTPPSQTFYPSTPPPTTWYSTPSSWDRDHSFSDWDSWGTRQPTPSHPSQDDQADPASTWYSTWDYSHQTQSDSWSWDQSSSHHQPTHSTSHSPSVHLQAATSGTI